MFFMSLSVSFNVFFSGGVNYAPRIEGRVTSVWDHSLWQDRLGLFVMPDQGTDQQTMTWSFIEMDS